MHDGFFIFKVHLNGKRVLPPFSNNDFDIKSNAIQMMLEIPEIEATVWFKGLSFYVDLPYSHFHNNTEGQCGEMTTAWSYDSYNCKINFQRNVTNFCIFFKVPVTMTEQMIADLGMARLIPHVMGWLRIGR